jgi:hypothetical protein
VWLGDVLADLPQLHRQRRDPDADPRAHTHANSDANANSHAYPNTDADTRSDIDPDPPADADRDTDDLDAPHRVGRTSPVRERDADVRGRQPGSHADRTVNFWIVSRAGQRRRRVGQRLLRRSRQ